MNVNPALAVVLNDKTIPPIAPVKVSTAKIEIPQGPANPLSGNIKGAKSFEELQKVTKIRKTNKKQQETITIKLKNFKKTTEPSKNTRYQLPSDNELKNNAKGFLEKFKNFKGKLSSTVRALFVETASADEFVPLIEYYDGIAESPADHALYYVSTKQNEDGSFGDYNQFIFTSELVDRLARYNLTDNTQFTSALNYLTNYNPINNRELAIKIRLLKALGQNYDTQLAAMRANKNSDGGYGLEEYYDSDIISTIEVFNTYNTVGYNADDAPLRVLVYLLLRVPDDGNLAFTPNSNMSYYLTDRLLQALKPYEDLRVEAEGANGAISILIRDKINNLLGALQRNYDTAANTILGSKAAIDYAATLDAFKLYNVLPGEWLDLEGRISGFQAMNGSFGNDWSALVAGLKIWEKADLKIINAEAVGALQNGQPATLRLTIKNTGQRSADDAKLYIFVDDYKMMEMDLSGQGLVIDPKDMVNLEFAIPNPSLFIGQNKFTFYIESQREKNFANNWLEKDFVFANNPDGLAAMPLYFTAYKFEYANTPAMIVNVPIKNDPNRFGYVLGIRPDGGTDNDWSFYNFDPVNGNLFYRLPEGARWEVTVGVLTSIGGIPYITDYFTNATDVHLSANPNNYNGSVQGKITLNNQPLSGAKLNDGVTVTNQSGDFTIPAVRNGTGVYSVGLSQYQPLTTRVQVTENQTLQDVRVFTRLKPDSVAPVANSLIVQEEANGEIPNGQEINLTVQGTDNVALKTADIFYWDPADGIWTYALSLADPQNGTFSGKWFVPSALEGGGYSLRVVLWDFQNNVSAPLDHGPFSFVNKRPPAGVSGLYADYTNNKIVLDWNAYPAAQYFSKFNVYRATGVAPASLDGLAPLATINNVQTTNYDDVGVAADTDYYYAVSVTGANGMENRNVTWVGPAYYVNNNLVTDGSMYDPAVWMAWGAPTVNEKIVETTKQSRVSHVTSLANQANGLQKDMIVAQSGHNYELKFKAKVGSGTLVPRVNIRGNANYNKFLDFAGLNVTLSSADYGSWKEYKRTFRLPDDYDSNLNRIRLALLADGGATGAEVWIDDVSIADKGTSTNIVGDGDMEAANMNYWVNYGTPAIAEKITEASFGSKVAHVTTKTTRDASNQVIKTTAGIQQLGLRLSPGKTYELSFDTKIGIGLLYPKLTIAGNVNYNKQSDFANNNIVLRSTDYQNKKGYIRRFTVPVDFNSATNRLDLRFILQNEYKNNVWVDGNMWLDNVSVIEVRDVNNPILDFNMEALSPNTWLNFGTLGQKEKMWDAVRGSQVIYFRTNNVPNAVSFGGVQQIGINNAMPGRTYRLSFWYNLPVGTVLPRIGIKNSNSDFEFPQMGTFPVLRAGNDWRSYTRDIIIPLDFTGDLRVVFALYSETSVDGNGTRVYGGPGELFLDDVKLELVD